MSGSSGTDSRIPHGSAQQEAGRPHEKLGIRLVAGVVISDYSHFIAERRVEDGRPPEHKEFSMARIISFYIPASHRTTPRKPAGSLGMAQIIPFPLLAKRGEVSFGPPERVEVRRILHNNGILGLFAGH